MKFIKRHKLFLIILFVAIILIFLAGAAVYSMFYPSNDKNIYGSRVEGAPKIEEEIINKIEEEMLATNLVHNFSYKTNVATMKFFIDVNNDVKIKNAQDLSDIIDKNLSSNIKEFYDIEIYLTQKSGDFIEYPAIGYHSKLAESFSWTINKEVVTDEE